MRAKMPLFLVALGFSCQGCAPLWQSARTSLIEPFLYRRQMTAARENHRNKELAEEAWADFFGKHPDLDYSKDFECGFKEGFADYLFWGGTGAPPPVPPRCYWNYKYETPEGHKAAQNWFAGFRTGAQCAKESGYRQLVLIPASTCLPTLSTGTTPSSPGTSMPVPGLSPGAGSRTEEMLPPPKPLPGTDNSSMQDAPTTKLAPDGPAPGNGLGHEPPALKGTNRTNTPPSGSPLPALGASSRPGRMSSPESSTDEDQQSSGSK